MVDSKSLIAEIVKNGLTQSVIADKIGLSTTSLNYKINNKRKFYCEEVLAICKILKLSADDLNKIFFAKQLDFKSNSTEGYGEYC